MASEASKTIANNVCKRIRGNEYGFATCVLLHRSTPAIARKLMVLAGASPPVDAFVAYVADINAMQMYSDHKLFLIKEKDDSDASHVDQTLYRFITNLKEDSLGMEAEAGSGRGRGGRNVSSDMPLNMQ